MTRTANSRISFRTSAKALLISASTLALASGPAQAAEVLFSTSGQTEIAEGQRIMQGTGLLQVKLDSGATLSFTDGAEFRINADGSLDLFKGSVTVAGAGSSETVVRMPEGVEGRVGGTGNAASFSVGEEGASTGHTLTGAARIQRGRNDREFGEGQMWMSAGSSGIRRVLARGSQNTPAAEPEVQVADMKDGGPVAAAENGLPVSLGDALAAAGASGDIVTAARRVEAANGNPQLEGYPAGDLALLVALAGNLEGAYAGRPFPAAQADIIRTYLGFLAEGGSGANFVTAYAGFLTQYLDLIRAGGVPSNFDAVGLAEINAFLAYRANLGALGSLSARDEALAEAYLAFLRGGGNGDLFAAQFTDLIEAYFAFVRGGGNPLDFTGATQDTVDAYIAFLASSGLAGQLSEQNQAVLAAYLASGGFNFAAQYAASLEAYFAFLAAGNLPSQYGELDPAAVQAYLEALQASGLFNQLLGAQAQFYANYLAHLQGGGDPDLFAGLPNADLVPLANALNAYAVFLANGGLPSDFDATGLATLAAYFEALDNAGQLNTLLGANADLIEAYFAYFSGGGNIDNFAGLPIYADYAAALQAYYAFLENGGLPADYTALTAQQISAYLAALSAAGGFAGQLGDLSDFYTAYFAYLSTGGAPGQFSGLPVYADYVSALNAYFAFLSAGGLPGDYTVLTPQQVEDYLAALQAAGGFGAYGNLNGFFAAYFAFISSGGDPGDYTALPIYADYLAAIANFYAYLLNGGSPSAYTALTQQQVEDYLAVLADLGLLASNFSGGQLDFYTSYLAYLAGGGVPDDFDDLPAGGGGDAGVLYAADFSPNGGLAGLASAAQVTDDGQIESITFSPSSGDITYDYASSGDTLREHGRFGDDVAWTRYERGAEGGISNFNSHLLVGTEAVNLPASGNVEFNLLGGTAPTDAFAPAGEVGHFSGRLAVAFKPVPEIGLDLDVFVGTRGWNVATRRGADDPTFAGILVENGMNFQDLGTKLATTGIAGDACTAYCNTNLFGSLFGDGGDYVGFAYLIQDESGGSANRSYVNGVAVYGQGGTALSGLGTMPAPPELTTAEKIAAVEDYLAFLRADGLPSAYSAASLASIRDYFNGSGFHFANNDPGGQFLLENLFRHALNNGNPADGFAALPVNGGDTVQVQTAYSLPTNGGTFPTTFGVGPRFVLIDSNGYIVPTFTNGIPTSSSLFGVNGQNVAEFFTNDSLTVARLTGITAFYSGQPYTIPDNGGAHYAFVPVLPELVKDMTVHYELQFATSPTFLDGTGTPGTFDADIAINFNTSGYARLATEGTISMPGDANYSFSTDGGIANVENLPITTFISFASSPLIQQSAIDLTGTGKACMTGADCTLYLAALPGGADAQYLGVSYETRNGGSGSVTIMGAAGFEAGDAPTDISLIKTNLFSADARLNSSSDLGTHPLNLSMTVPAANSTIGYEVDGSGEIVGLVREGGFGGTDRIGTASNADSGVTTSGGLRWTRWTDGVLAVTRNAGPGNAIGLSANQGYHFIVGEAATNLPASGRIDYDLVGGTSPTQEYGAAAPGSLVSGGAAVEFGATPKVGIELALDYNSSSYNAQTTGGLADLSSSELTLADGAFYAIGAFGNVTGGSCGASCRAIWTGFLSGDGGTELGLEYILQLGNSANELIGTAAFEQSTGGGTETFDYEANQSVAYAGSTVGLDSRNRTESAYDASGRPIAYTVTVNDFTSENERPTIGDAVIAEGGSVGDLVGWARWTDGTTGGRYYATEDGWTFGPNDGFHLVSGDKVSNIPASGNVTYSLAGATSPTVKDGSATPGTFAGTMSVAFGATPTADFDFTVGIAEGSYGFGATDRPIEASGDFVGGFFANGMAVSGTGSVCPTGACQAQMRGMLFGDGASAIGVSYNFAESGKENLRTYGAAAFTAEVPPLGSNPYANAPQGAHTLAQADDWDRWEVDSGAIGIGNDMAMLAPGMEATTMRGVQFSADQLALLEAHMAAQGTVR